MIFTEGKLQFDFDDEGWQEVLKYDELTDYRKLEAAIKGTKGVDFVAVLQNHTLLFIEVKDFRGYQIESKDRVLKELHDEIATKVRDTLAGIVGAAKNSTHHRAAFQYYVDFLKQEKKAVQVLLWIEEDLPSEPTNVRDKRERLYGGTLTKRLKTKLNWLTTKVLVANIKENPYPSDLKVISIP